MKFTKTIYKLLLKLFNYPYISEELRNLEGPIVLHISDTPMDIYNFIFRTINILKPQFIIHTGDMVDNIKLGINRNKIDSYYKGVTKLIKGLEKNEYSKIYYVLGNHDDYETVSQLSKRGIILEEGALVIDNCTFTVGHYYKEYPNKTNFNLYGHHFEPNHYKKEDTIGLNGLLSINVIDLSTKKYSILNIP